MLVLIDVKYFTLVRNLFSIIDLKSLHYLYFDKEFALFLLNQCIMEDEEKSKELFSLYSDLQNEIKIVNLFPN